MKITDGNGKEYEVDTKYINIKTDVEFVNVWAEAYKAKTGLKAMCETYNISYTEASQWASRLRRAGVKLPTMPKAKQKSNILETDVKGLNRVIIAKLGIESMSWRTR